MWGIKCHRTVQDKSLKAQGLGEPLLPVDWFFQFLSKEQGEKKLARTSKHPPLSSRHTGSAVSATSSRQKQALQFPHGQRNAKKKTKDPKQRNCTNNRKNIKPSIHVKRQGLLTNWTREMLSGSSHVPRGLSPLLSSATRAGHTMLVQPPILAQKRQREAEVNK